MENKTTTNSNYNKLVNKHTSIFNKMLEEFKTETPYEEMNPSIRRLNEYLEFSKNIGELIPDITPVRYEIIGRIEAARMALEDEHLEKVRYHIMDASMLWQKIEEDLKNFEMRIIKINNEEP